MEGGSSETAIYKRSSPASTHAQQEQVREALNTIPHEQLKILELAYFSGYTHVEISERLELPLGTVKGRMRLGLQKLRDYYQARGAAVPR